jgi:protein-S-isoprenylcysteine O-methyltransferase Ste14
MSARDQDRSGAVVIPPVVYLGFFLVGLALDLLFPVPLLPDAIQYGLGIVLIVASIALIPFSFHRFHALGTPLDVRKPTTAIITDGPYRFSRNPVYLAMTLLYCGIAVVLDGVWVVAMLIPVLIVMRYGVIRREEGYLEAKFGAEYVAYKRTVRRWL